VGPLGPKHHKLHPLRYGPYKVLKCISDNPYKLELPPQLSIHDVLNVSNLKWFEPSLLEEEVHVQHPIDVIPEFQPSLLGNKILEQRTRNMRAHTYTYYLVDRKG